MSEMNGATQDLGRSRSSSEHDAYKEGVRAYHDDWNAVIVEAFGSTYQRALFRGADGRATQEASNREIARRAGLRPGDRVLDAGCGTGGPALDIARAVPGVTIEGVTISPAQAASAQTFIESAGLGDRVRVRVADFHALPFEDASFDAVIYLETSSYSLDQTAMFREAHRVLAEHGRIYVKTVVVETLDLDAEARAQLKVFNDAYAWNMTTIEDEMDSARAAGFTILACRNIMPEIDMEFGAGQFVTGVPGAALTPFGRRHQTPVDRLPIYFAEFVAVKRGYAGSLFG